MERKDEEIETVSDEDCAEVAELCREDPLFHIQAVQGVQTVEPFQAEILRAIAKYKRVAIRSCHDMGKTWTMSKAVIWFLTTHPEAKIVSSAPTARQVKLLLWSEIRAGHLKSLYPLGGEMGIQDWKIAPDWWAVGFTTQKQASEGQGQKNSGFQGIHGEWVIVIFDEATGIAPDVWKQLEGLLTSDQVKFIPIGNPTTKACDFFKCFSDPSYKKLHLSCFDSPNLIANGIQTKEDLVQELQKLMELTEEERLERLSSYNVIRPKLLTTEWVMGMVLRLGIDHPLVVSKCFGEFPDEDESCLMPMGIVEAAQHREPDEKPAKGEKLYIGVDVARKGNDKSVITRLRGSHQKAVKVLVKRRTTAVSGAVISMVNDLPVEERLTGGVITVDATGIGSGVCDELVAYQVKTPEWKNIRIQEFHCGERFKSPRDGTEAQCKKREKRYVNKKAEAFILLAEALKEDLSLLKDAVYQEELPTIQFEFDKNGRWQIEDKDAYKKRTGRGSPDHADSLSLANFGRYYSGGVGTFTEDMAKPQGKPLAGRLGEDE